MVGYIYLIIDLTNWKKYVGQHHYHLEKLDSNYHGSGTIISKIYKKRPHTLKEVYLKTCYTQEELDEWEQYYIEFYNTLSPNGYNLQEGGRGGVPSEDARRKMSKAHKGLCAGEKHPMFGKHHSEESKKKMSNAKKGKPSHNKGKPMSEETKKKLSESKKGLLSGEKNPMFGKHHSDETKQKISKVHKGKHISEEQKKKLSSALKGRTSPNKGKPMSEEQKKKLREANTNGKQSKRVLQLTLDDEFVREWESTNECGRNGFNQGNVAACCRGKLKSAYGFKWCYAEE